MGRVIFVAILFLADLALAQDCPPSEILAPCTCDEQKKVITCQWINEEWDVKETFDAASEAIDSDVIFNKLELFDTNLESIEQDAISSLKFRRIEIKGNPQLTFISPQAFNATYAHTTTLSLWNNRLTNKNNEYDIFQFISKFTQATSIDLTLNELTQVPENAFEFLPALTELLIPRNAITQVKSFAFSGLTNLKSLSLTANQISPIGVRADSFLGISPNAVVSLASNPIEFLEEGIFKPLVDGVTLTTVGTTSCDLDDYCNYKHLICDARAEWICSNVDYYEQKLAGFMCSDEQSVFDYCREQTGQLKNNIKL